ncbi:MAG: S41 family peptidase [Verrucomicrobiota bacterium]
MLVATMMGGAFVSRSKAATEPENDTGDRLWQSFIEKYNAYSLKPLDAESLDAKARAELLSTAGFKFRSWKPENQATFPAMLQAMTEKDPEVSKFDRVEKTLTTLLPKIDTYGHYKSAASVAQLKAAMGQNPGKVQMALYVTDDGYTRCDPQPDGPADLAGVKPGARLLTVNQIPVEGNNTDALTLAFLGPPDTPVVIKIKQPQGKTEELTLIRTDKISPVVTTKKTALGVTVRIRRFDPGTAADIKEQLAAYPKIGRLTLDLRGNAGGLRKEAFITASLFFPLGASLGQFTTREKTWPLDDPDEVIVDPASIQILQNERTASAAEYLIAVLKEGMPEKVSLFGKKTYGKSHSTARVILDGGGELAVTETLLATASGRSWDKIGISPDEMEKE